MSEGDSPHGALSDSETNNSIINKVRSRVSSIIPNSFSKWFSPKAEGKNGSNRRRREISEEQDSSNDESYNQEEENGPEPPVKRTKCDLLEQSSTSVLDDSFSPSTSRLNSRNNSTRIFETRTTSTATSSNARKLSSTPSTSLLLDRHRRYLGLNKNVSSTPYDFNAKTFTNEHLNYKVNQHNNNYNNNNLETSHYSRGLDVKKRRKLDSIGERSSNTNNNNYERSLLNSSAGSGMYRKDKSFNNNNNLDDELAGSDIFVEEEDDEDEVDELTLPIVDGDVDRKFNGMHGTPSESEGSICSYIERPGSSTDIMNLNDDDKGIHRSHTNLKNTKTGINFSSHLQSEKSLFSDKNLSSSLTNSSMSLNSWNRRPSFNASLYGSTSALSDSRLLNVKSPFYDGQTIYGGASTYAKNISRMQKALRVPVQIRPVSSLSTSSSSSNSNNNPVLSNTAKRILDLMNQYNTSSPLNDAKKMGSTLSSRVPPLSLARHNHILEDELNLNRSIRLNSAKSPYSRPDNKITRPVNKSLTTELQIPSVSQLLQIKRLQNKTEELRQLANESKSILNTNKTATEYKLPANDNKDSDLINNNSNKHTNKIKNKISATRPDKKQTNDDEPPIPVNLPNISFPAMKSVPQFDITLPTSKQDTTRPVENKNLLTSTAKKSNTNVSPKLGGDLSSSNPMRSDNFKFEFLSSSNKMPVPAAFSNSVNKKANAISSDFAFSEPIQVSKTLKAPADSTANSVNINFEFRKPIPITKTSNSSLTENETALVNSGKKICAPTAPPTQIPFSENVEKKPTQIPTFMFSENLNNPFTVPKPKEHAPKAKSQVSKESPKLPGELKSGSVMDLLMKYKNDKVKADEPGKETQVTPPKEEKPLNDIFKPKVGTWECDVCMIRNDSSINKCVACETPKPGAQNSVSSSIAPINPFKPAEVPPVKDDLFKKILEKQNEKWECSTCVTRNESSRNKCICCEQAKPGAEVSDVPFSFAKVETKFSFGIPAGIPNTTSGATLVSIAPTTTMTNSNFTFGIATTSNTSSSVILPSYKFGGEPVVSSAQTSNPVVPAVAPSTFTFGTLKPIDKVDAPKPINIDNTIDDTKLKLATNSIFGSPITSNSGLFSHTPSTSVPPQASVSAKPPDTSKKPETANFMFGIQNVSKPAESPLNTKLGGSSETVTTPSSTSTNSSSVGGFKFTPPNSVSSATSTNVSGTFENKQINTTPVTAATSTTLIGQQVTPTFGQTSGFSLFKKPESSPLAITPLVTKAETKPAAPTFGSISQVSKNESTPQPIIPTEPKPASGTFVFGTPANTTAKTENIFGSSTINPAPPVTTSASTFGSPAGFGFSTATTTNSSITSPFSGFGTNTTTPTIGFGTKLNQSVTPTFGSFSSTNTTNQSTATTNNVNKTQPAVPVFGMFGATESVSPPTNNATFGQPAKIFGVSSSATDTSTAGGFGSNSGNIFGHNTTSATFGSQQQAQSNFGSQSATPLPTFGATATSFNPPPQQNDTAPAAKNIFQFGGAQQTNEQPPPSNNPFQFGAANSTNTNSAPKPNFNFSTTTPTSFNFTATAPTTNSAQPFTFGAPEAQPPAASGGFNFGSSSTEVASNSPFQFGATPANNPFAATPAGPPRRKVKPARRLR